MIRSWVNSGFSVESTRGPIVRDMAVCQADREALGQCVVRRAVSLEKVNHDAVTDMVSAYPLDTRKLPKRISIRVQWKRFVTSSSWISWRVCTLSTYLPPGQVQLVRCYGIYSGRMHPGWPERVGIVRFAPESWKQSHRYLRAPPPPRGLFRGLRLGGPGVTVLSRLYASWRLPC